MPNAVRVPFPAKENQPSLVPDAIIPQAREYLDETPASLLSVVTDFMESRGGGDGFFQTPVEGLSFMRAAQEIPAMRNLYQPSLCVVLTGSKEMLFGDSILNYGEMEYLVVSMEIPVKGRMVGPTPQAPFVGMSLEFDFAMLGDVMRQLPAPSVSETAPGPCVFVGRVDAPLADCLTRLARLTQSPEAIPVLSASIMREICYWMLTGPFGGEIAKLALPETQSERVARAIRHLHVNFNETLRVEQLAALAGMSRSSFHQHFRAVTGMTPVQFQKQLRLLEARRLMVHDGANVSKAAYQVGYESASQFSREYARAFGQAPKRDVMQFKSYLGLASR